VKNQNTFKPMAPPANDKLFPKNGDGAPASNGEYLGTQLWWIGTVGELPNAFAASTSSIRKRNQFKPKLLGDDSPFIPALFQPKTV
jgi:hypothetical protein